LCSRDHKEAAVLLNASGCLDALTARGTAAQLDAFVTKTVTPEPRPGNAPVRIAEVEHGMLNSIGLANPGRERFLAETLPQLQELGMPLWVSVGGFCAADYADTCAALEDVEAIELNLSCPNVALAAVHTCYAATQMPIVGMGGITSGQDALELVACGARHVALGTVLFSDPDAPARIRAELAAAAAELGFATVADARGAAHPGVVSDANDVSVPGKKSLETGKNVPA